MSQDAPAHPSEQPPQVSIVIATYNRSNVLRFTIASVLRQSVRDWEMIVVGDACTDDTEQVVAGFGDPRIRFFNLPENSGEQTGPSNAGLRLARGRFVAFLNHDDLWFPDHLEHCLREIEQTSADLVFSLGIVVAPDGRRWLLGASDSAWYGPHIQAPASSWLARRELIESLGGWRSARQLFGIPSQDLLFRAWKAGKRLRATHRVSLFVIQSGVRQGSYANRDELEHKLAFERMISDSSFRETEFSLAAVALFRRSESVQVWPLLKRIVRNIIYRICIRLGLSCQEVMMRWQHRSRGRLLDELRRTRGLPKMNWKKSA